MIEDLRVLIIGGYGSFGGRIVELLRDEPSLTLVVSGRSLDRASACCTRTAGAATLVPAAFDRDGDLADQLARLKPDLLIDASGPFQGYGSGRYRVIEACLALQINYLDLADSSDFVAGIGTLDEAARRHGCFALSGASSFPALTAAVVRRLSADMVRVDGIIGGVAPSPYAIVGENVVRAIAGYAGQAVPVHRDGKTAMSYPFTEYRRFTIAPPGCLPLCSRLFSLVDVPDLRQLAMLCPEAQSVWIGAAPAPAILHRILAAMAWLVRWRIVPTLSPLAPAMHLAMRHLRWGERRGGMFVRVEGADASGLASARSWHLIAEGETGPYIPAMAAAALVRKTLQGVPPGPGARAATRELELEDYAPLFAERSIKTGCRQHSADDASPLYADILGAAFDRLPSAIRAMHAGTSIASGRASVERGNGLLSRLVAACVGFPPATEDTPVSVRFDAGKGAELWTRTFGAKVFSSRQFAGRGRSERLLCEGFGPLTFTMALVADGARLSLVLRGWRAFGIPMPLFLAPRSNAHETVEDGRFRFHVEIRHPLTGLIVRYRGWLVPAESGTKPG